MKRPSIYLVLFLLLFPLVQAYLYFVLMAEWNPIFLKGTYSFTKVIMLALPLFYMIVIAKERWFVRPFHWRGMFEGSMFGIGVLVAMCLMYYLWLKPIGLIGPGTDAGQQIAERVESFGMATPVRFLLFGVFVSLIHSGLEEYYWRWFTFGQLKCVIPNVAAIIISGLGFMLHHIIILGVYFGFTRLETWLFSFAVAIGGMYWSWLYQRKDSIYAPWISHAWIDIAIFVVGYDVMFGSVARQLT